MAGGKGKSIGGKGAPGKDAGRAPKSHSAKAGLQVCSRPLRDDGLDFDALRPSCDVSRSSRCPE